MEQRVSLITLGVADLGRAARFYENGLGWKRGNDTPDVVFFQGPGMIIALWPRAQLAEDAGIPARGSGFAGIALAYNTRTREEVNAVLAEAEAAGGHVVKPAADTFWAAIRATSPTRMAISGKLRSTRAGASMERAGSISLHRLFILTGRA